MARHFREPEQLPQQQSQAVAQPEESREQQVGRNTALMSVLVVVSRLTGFVRTWAQAFALGVTVIASCYSVANNLPNQLYEIVVGGMLVTAFLPVYLSERQKRGSSGASEYTSNLVSIVTLLMGALTVLAMVFAWQVVFTQSFTATDEFDSALAVYFFRFFAIEVLLYALSSIFSGVLNAERDYFWSSAAPIFNNFVTTASFLLYAWLAPTNPQLALVILALGNPLGVLVQVVVQMPSLRKYGIRLRWRIDLSDPALKETLRIGVPSLVVMLCSFETVSVMTSAALSVTATGASISYYARLWFTLPYAILAVPITTAMFTELSHDVAADDMDAYRAGVSGGTSKIVFSMVPFMMYLVVFSVPLVTLLAAGRFGADEIRVTAEYLAALAISLPSYAVCTYLQKVCSSLRRMGIYTWASVAAAAVQTVICLVLTPVFGLNVVPLSSTAYMLVVDAIAFVSLRRHLGNLGLRSVLVALVRATLLGLAGSAVGYGCGFVLTGMLGITGSTTMQALIQIVAGGIPAVLVTFGAALAMHLPEVSAIEQLAGRLLGKLHR